jgi:hypothetical protein
MRPMAGNIAFSSAAFRLQYRHPSPCPEKYYLKEQIMRAIRFEAFGDPSILEVVEAAAPAADERTALVRIMAASINPSDVKNVAGAMKQATMPRFPVSPEWSRRAQPNGSAPRGGHGRRRWLYPRRDPCRADRRASPAGLRRKPKNPQLSMRRRRSASITWPLGAVSMQQALRPGRPCC